MTDNKGGKPLFDNFRPTDVGTRNLVPTGSGKPVDPMAKPPFPIGGPVGGKPSSSGSERKTGGGGSERKK
jgi:hypothetical protein